MSDQSIVDGKWSISHWNYHEALLKELAFDPDCIFYDQTLRDGLQFSGIEFSQDEKVEIVRRLGRIGIKRIEAGRVSTEQKDVDLVKRIVKLNCGARIFGFCEMSAELVKVAVDCGVEGVVLCFPTNNHGIVEKMGSSVEEVTKIAIEMARTANDLGMETVLFGTDAGRADPESYRQMIGRIAEQAHFDALTFVDTVGGCSPLAIPHIMKFLRTVTDKPLEAHFHNDFGLAVANSIAALACGVRAAHTTVLGMGERTGNAAMEQAAMVLLTMYDKDLGLDMAKLYELCHYVGNAASLPVSPNQPIVGSRIFEIECRENLLGYFHPPPEVAAKYTFPYHWSLVGQNSVDVALGNETNPEALEIVLGLLDKADMAEAEKEKLLQSILTIAEKEKRSVPRKEIAEMIDDY